MDRICRREFSRVGCTWQIFFCGRRQPYRSTTATRARRMGKRVAAVAYRQEAKHFNSC